MSSEKGKILAFSRAVNGVAVEQRKTDGFINGTAMCTAHGKLIADWFRNQDTIDLINALVDDLGLKINYGISHNSSIAAISAAYPQLIVSKRGSPAAGGGTWLQPDLALQLAQWCNKPFAIQVSKWIREWLTTGQNPFTPDVDQEFMLWQQRYDIRVYLKDFLRPELMNSVVRWAQRHGKSPIVMCAEVHDLMNQRIQGLKSKEIKLLHGLPLGELIRDYFDASPLVNYSAINKLAKNGIDDRGLEPTQAVNEACDHFLGKAYIPTPVTLAENLYTKGRRLKEARKRKQLPQAAQLELPLWGEDQVS